MGTFTCMAKAHKIDMDKKVSELTDKEKEIIFYGSDKKLNLSGQETASAIMVTENLKEL